MFIELTTVPSHKITINYPMIRIVNLKLFCQEQCDILYLKLSVTLIVSTNNVT